MQDITIEVKNTRFRLARWLTPEGTYHTATLPNGYAGYHFGTTLRAYILHQYYHQCVTQNLLLAQLKEWGLFISSGELNRLLMDNKAGYHEDKKKIYIAGLRVSNYLQVDDTGARHKGQNHACTHIGNEYFSVFHTTRYKNHTNFLTLLHSHFSISYQVSHELIDEMMLISTRSDPFQPQH